MQRSGAGLVGKRGQKDVHVDAWPVSRAPL